MGAVPYIEEHTVEGFVRATALELWDLLTDPEALAEARSEITSIELLDGEMGEVGGRTRTMLKVGRTELMLTEETTAAERPRLLARSAMNPRVTSQWEWTLEDADGGCKVIAVSRLEAQLGALQRWAVKRQHLSRVKDANESLHRQCEELSAYFDERRATTSFDI
ncbi:SRPBCC family protein [Demequina sp. NBRC 110052]|uniref:SRPBCC family protein n=1 Tax=Demequina sp. NBRC 110052 TaxID=1570341 RepID=UPI0013564402|nr:SRPBCC family protein [Demequina sp. NBRC 110052]